MPPVAGKENSYPFSHIAPIATESDLNGRRSSLEVFSMIAQRNGRELSNAQKTTFAIISILLNRDKQN